MTVAMIGSADSERAMHGDASRVTTTMIGLARAPSSCGRGRRLKPRSHQQESRLRGRL